MKHLKFWLKCIRISWNDRVTPPSRQKYRRLAVTYDKARRKVGL